MPALHVAHAALADEGVDEIGAESRSGLEHGEVSEL
jgi:hypothetical protein